MYKTTQDNLDRVQRVGSHATKSSPTGRIDELPIWAKEAEEYFNSLNEQFDSLNAQREAVERELQNLNKTLKGPYPAHIEIRHVKTERDRLAAQIVELQREAARFRIITRAAAVNAWGTVYYHCAMLILDKETRMRIEDECRKFLGRNPTADIAKATQERGDRHQTMKRKQFNKTLNSERSRRLGPERRPFRDA